MHWESPNERDAFHLLDFRWDVIAYREQACEIIYVDDVGREAAHYPDIEVLTVDGRELWEVKTDKFARLEPICRRTEILAEALPALGITYRLAIAEELRAQPRLNSMRKVLHFGNRIVTGAERTDVAQELVHSGRIVWGEACKGRLGPDGRGIICRLVLEGFLQFDTTMQLCETTEIFPGFRSW